MFFLASSYSRRAEAEDSGKENVPAEESADSSEQTPETDISTPPGDETSIKSFPRNLWKNTKSLFSKKNLKPFLIGGGAAAAAILLDDEVEDFFDHDPRRFKELGDVGDALGSPVVVVGATTGLFVMGQYSEDDRFRSMTYALGQSVVLNKVFTLGIKYAVGRERPNEEDSTSFPSGHTSDAFTFATVLTHYYGSRAGVPAYIVASAIGVSRMEKNKHHLSDVMAGAALGYIIGKTVSRRTGIDDRHRKVTWIPMAAPRDGGFEFAVIIRF